MDPSKRLHVFQIRMLWALMRQGHILVTSYLRNKDNGSDLLDLRIFGWRDSIHVASNLDSQIRDADESFEDILGKHIGIAHLS